MTKKKKGLNHRKQRKEMAFKTAYLFNLQKKSNNSLRETELRVIEPTEKLRLETTKTKPADPQKWFVLAAVLLSSAKAKANFILC